MENNFPNPLIPLTLLTPLTPRALPPPFRPVRLCTFLAPGIWRLEPLRVLAKTVSVGRARTGQSGFMSLRYVPGASRGRVRGT